MKLFSAKNQFTEILRTVECRIFQFNGIPGQIVGFYGLIAAFVEICVKHSAFLCLKLREKPVQERHGYAIADCPAAFGEFHLHPPYFIHAVPYLGMHGDVIALPEKAAGLKIFGTGT